MQKEVKRVTWTVREMLLHVKNYIVGEAKKLNMTASEFVEYLIVSYRLEKKRKEEDDANKI